MLNFLQWLITKTGITFYGLPFCGKTVTAEALSNLIEQKFGQAPIQITDVGKKMREIHTEDPTRFSNVLDGMVKTEEFTALVDSLATQAMRNQEVMFFCGQPRLKTEAQHFINNNYLSFVFFLSASDEELTKRWRTAQRHRSDDTEDVFIKKTAEQKLLIYNVMDFCQKNDIAVHTIDATGSIEENAQKILKLLEKNYEEYKKEETEKFMVEPALPY